MRRLGLLVMALCACGAQTKKEFTTIEGDLLPFFEEVGGPRVANAKVSILELPERTFTTGTDAHFKFEQIEVGSEVTLVVEAAGYKTTQTATLKVGAKGINPLPIQLVSEGNYTLLAGLLAPPEPELDKYCGIATTVARMGGGLYAHLRQGLPGVSLSISPTLSHTTGPFYFNENAQPDRVTTATTIDGGGLFYRVPPGDYTLSASRDGLVFNTVKLKCRAGFIVNAGPPLGIVAHVKDPDYGAGTGVSHDGDLYYASTAAMCEMTRQCVNQREAAENYPVAQVISCKAHYGRMWAWLDDACASSSGVKDAAKAVYDCRSANCDKALGDDTACPDQETAFRAAELTYGACVAAK